MGFQKFFFDNASEADVKNKFPSGQNFKPFVSDYGLNKYVSWKCIVLFILLVCLIVTMMYFRYQGHLSPEIIFEFINSFTFMAPFVFVIIYVVFMCLMLPTLPLNIGAGFLWGPVWGSIITIVGCGLGVICAFAVGRLILSGFLAHRFDNRIIAWLQSEIDNNGWKVVAFTRVNPVFPTGPINFLFGMTSIRFSTYVWSSITFLSPFIVMFAVIGSEANNFILRGEMINLPKAIFIGSGFITLTCFFYIVNRVYKSH